MHDQDDVSLRQHLPISPPLESIEAPLPSMNENGGLRARRSTGNGEETTYTVAASPATSDLSGGVDRYFFRVRSFVGVLFSEVSRERPVASCRTILLV